MALNSIASQLIAPVPAMASPAIYTRTVKAFRGIARAIPSAAVLCLLLVGSEAVTTQTQNTQEPKVQEPNGPGSRGQARVRYRIADLGPASRTTDDITFGLDQSGRIVTWYRERDFVVRASLWDAGRKSDIGALPGYPDTYASDINGDRVVGTSRASADTRFHRAFLRENGRMQDLGTLGGKYSRAYAVNSRGQLVGGANTASSDTHAFLRQPGENRELIDLGTLADGNYSVAEDINKSGVVVGVANLTKNGKNHAVLWDKQRIRDLGTLPHGTSSHARAINNLGQVVGWGLDAEGDTHAILWEHGKARDLGVLVTDPSSAWSINNRGQVVGTSGFKANRPLHAVLWERGKIVDLNDLIPPDSGWLLQGAYRINDAGTIVGIGIHGDELRAFVLTPVPSGVGGKNSNAFNAAHLIWTSG